MYIQPNSDSDKKKVNTFLCSDLIWLPDQGPGNPIRLDLPASKIILCQVQDETATYQKMHPLSKSFDMGRSVRLVIRSSLDGKQSRMVCGYFNQPD